MLAENEAVYGKMSSFRTVKHIEIETDGRNGFRSMFGVCFHQSYLDLYKVLKSMLKITIIFRLFCLL